MVSQAGGAGVTREEEGAGRRAKGKPGHPGQPGPAGGWGGNGGTGRLGAPPGPPYSSARQRAPPGDQLPAASPPQQ